MRLLKSLARKIPSPSLSLATVLIFWIFNSGPRLWILARSPGQTPVLSEPVMWLLFIGFLRDGLAAALIFVLFKWLEEKVVVRSYTASFALKNAVLLFLGVIVGFGFASAEYSRHFGSFLGPAQLEFAKPTQEGLFLFIGGDIPLELWLLVLAGFPLALYFISLLARAPRLEVIFWWRNGTATALFLFAAAALGYAYPLSSETDRQMVKNPGLVLIQNALHQTSLSSGEKGGNLNAIFDLIPPADQNPAQFSIPDSNFPLVQGPAQAWCQNGTLPREFCQQDQDGDGFTLMEDCRDLDPSVHPGADDIPGNGLDEDCTGLDRDPPNIIFIHWEGARAVNTGSIGYSVPATPEFDRWAKKGVLFKNAYATAIQTRFSLISVYASILPRLSSKWIFKHNKELNLLGFPKVLRDKGYETIYVHGAHINYAQKGSRFKEWFETQFDLDDDEIKAYPKFEWGLKDPDLFEFAFSHLKNRAKDRPFFMALATLSVHFPYALPDSRYELAPHDDRKNQIPNLMRYSDAALGAFLDKLYSDPDLKNTLVLIAADHGLNWYAPHDSQVRSRLWEDSVWVPMLLLGNWNRPQGIDQDIRTLADIGPTVFDRLGIETIHHYIGHSLLKPAPDGAKAFFATANGGPNAGLRHEKYKYQINFETNQEWIYDMETDREENVNLSFDESLSVKKDLYKEWLTQVYGVFTDLIRENRIWPKIFDRI